MFVNREELKVLEDKLALAVNDRKGSTVFISGEPGIGKTTLVEHFMDNCDNQFDINILTGSGHCFDMDGVSRGFLPWKEVLIELDADKTAAKDLEKKNKFKKIVKTVFDKSGPEWFQNIPAVGEISAAIIETAQAMKKTENIDVKTGNYKELSFKDRLKSALNDSAGAWLGAIPIIGGFAEAIFKTSTKLMESNKDIQLKNQESFFQMVDEKLRDLATENPVVVFLDNLQWADNSSLSLLYYLAGKVKERTYPLLLVGSYRAQEIKEGRFNEITGMVERHPFEEKLNNLVRYHAAETLEIKNFDLIKVKTFIDKRFPENDFDENFNSKIYNLTKGNPLFLEEMLRNFLETGMIGEDSGTYGIIKDIDFINLPQTVSAIIKERFERLPDDLQEFLQIASVQGEMFSVDIISSILDEPAVKIHRKKDTLMNKYNLLETSRKISEGLGDMYQFTHNLVQNYIYYDMSKDYRLNVHKAIAGQYQGIDNEAVMLEFLFHFGVGNKIIDEKRNFILGQTGISPEVIDEYLSVQKKVADIYARSFKNDEALNMCGEIIKIAELTEREDLRVDYLIKEGEICQLTGKWAQAQEAFTLAFQHSLQLEDKRFLMSAAGSLSDLLRIQAKTFERTGDWNKAENLFRECLIYTEHTREPGLAANAYKNLAWILILLGSYVEAILNLDKAMEIYDEFKDKDERSRGINSIRSLLKKSLKVCNGIGDENGAEIITNALGKITDQY